MVGNIQYMQIYMYDYVCTCTRVHAATRTCTCTCLPCCLFGLACFFLPSFSHLSSLKTCVHAAGQGVVLSKGERAQQYVVGDEEIGASTEVPPLSPLSGDSLPDTADEIEIVDSSDSEEEEEEDDEEDDEISNVSVEVCHVRVCVYAC